MKNFTTKGAIILFDTYVYPKIILFSPIQRKNF